MQRDILRQLSVFHAVGAEGTISAAAKRLGKSPPAVHHDIAQLEQRLGEKLFRKSGRYLRLTSASRQLHLEVARSLDKLERDLDRFSRSAQDHQTLRVGAVTGFGRYRLASLLFEQAGDRQVELVTGSHDEVIGLLLGGRVDVGVTYRPVVATPITCDPLAEEQIVLIAALGTAPIEPSLSVIERLSFVTYDEYDYVFGMWFKEGFGKQPGRLLRSDHATELEEALESVANGRGVTITPADAWLKGPWRDRCFTPLGPAPDLRNPLFLLSIPGADTAAVSFISGLFGQRPA